MTETAKAWIDAATYTELLRRWRHAPAGDPMFRGDVGHYYLKVMEAKKAEDPGAAVAASKAIG